MGERNRCSVTGSTPLTPRGYLEQGTDPSIPLLRVIRIDIGAHVGWHAAELSCSSLQEQAPHSLATPRLRDQEVDYVSCLMRMSKPVGVGDPRFFGFRAEIFLRQHAIKRKLGCGRIQQNPTALRAASPATRCHQPEALLNSLSRITSCRLQRAPPHSRELTLERLHRRAPSPAL